MLFSSFAPSVSLCVLCGFPKPYFENIKKSPGFWSLQREIPKTRYFVKSDPGHLSSLLLDIDRRSPGFRKSPLTLWIDIISCRIRVHDFNCAVKLLSDENRRFQEHIQFSHRIDAISPGILFSVTNEIFVTILMPV